MKNQVFIVFDSLRFDVFKKANTPFIKSLGEWKKAWTQGTYTLPAHMSFFVGKLPQTTDNTDYYDTVASRFDPENGLHRNTNQLWRLTNPEAPREARVTLEGANIIEGFRQLGYLTIGSGAVNWFNPELPAARCLTDPFDHLVFLGHIAAEAQIAWAAERVQFAVSRNKPYFLFLNLGETHHPFRYKNCPWAKEPSPYGDSAKCMERQMRCFEYLDVRLKILFEDLVNYDLIMCSDHGEALGEDGLWGHGFCHNTVMEVPLLIVAD